MHTKMPKEFIMTTDNHDLIQHPALCAKYTVEKKLGHGTQGQMYLVRRASGERFAVKAYNLKTIPNWKASDLMTREIEVLQTLYVDRVPRCVDVIDASTSEMPYIFVVQEYVEGETLLDMINNGHRFSITDIIRITKDIARVLNDIGHTAKIIHRDVKPSNIMIDHEGRAWLVDFGSVVRHVKHEGGSTIAGTAGYMAPEQAIGDALPVSDIFGLGMSLIHLLTGIAPYNLDQQSLRPVFRPHLPQHIPAWFVDLIDQMIEPFAARRITAEQVLFTLKKGNPDDISWYILETEPLPELKGDVSPKKFSLMSIPPEAVFICISQSSIILLLFILAPSTTAFLIMLALYAVMIIFGFLEALKLQR